MRWDSFLHCVGVVEQLILCVHIWISLLNVGRCGRACVSWVMSGSGWAENRCSTTTFQAARLLGVASWRRTATPPLGSETAVREGTSSVTRGLETFESHWAHISPPSPCC